MVEKQLKEKFQMMQKLVCESFNQHSNLIVSSRNDLLQMISLEDAKIRNGLNSNKADFDICSKIEGLLESVSNISDMGGLGYAYEKLDFDTVKSTCDEMMGKMANLPSRKESRIIKPIFDNSGYHYLMENETLEIDIGLWSIMIFRIFYN